MASGAGARQGIFFKGYQALEASRQVDTVVLDKTGTVTEGKMAVTDVEGAPGVDRADAPALGGSARAGLRAPRGPGHRRRRRTRSWAACRRSTNSLALPGIGARGMVEGHEVSVGKAGLFADLGHGSCQPGSPAARVGGPRTDRRLVGRDDVIVGALAIADTIRPSAAAAVGELQALGLHCVLLTGDNEPTARAVGAAIGVADVLAGALPAEKVAVIRRLQAEGRSVAMVGDGVNDGPALASADLGLAVGSGTDVAINAADLIIVRDDLRVVATADRPWPVAP